MSRGQANLPALVVALLLVTASVGVTVGLAAGAFAGADADPADARLAGSLSERLVAADGPFSVRANVLSRAAVENASGDWLPEDVAVRVRLDGDTVLEQSGPDGGATMRRIVLVADAERRTFEPALTGRDAVTLPRRTANATLVLDPRPGVSVTAVRANDRVILRDSDGLDGTYDVSLARYDTVELSFDASEDLVAGSVSVSYRAAVTTKAVLEVTADA